MGRHVGLGQLLEEGQYAALAFYLEELLDYTIDPADLQEACEGFARPCRSCPDDYWYSWFKNRLVGAGLLPALQREPREVRLFTTLHVGFLAIYETEEELERLRNEQPAPAAAPVRSQVTKTNLVIQPIDRVAARVVPEERHGA